MHEIPYYHDKFNISENKSYTFLVWISLFWKISTFLRIIGIISVKEVAGVIAYSTFLVSQIHRRIKYSTFGVVYYKYAYKYSTAVVSWIRMFWSPLSPSFAGTRCKRERERELSAPCLSSFSAAVPATTPFCDSCNKHLWLFVFIFL